MKKKRTIFICSASALVLVGVLLVCLLPKLKKKPVQYAEIAAMRYKFAKNYEELAEVSEAVVLAKLEKKLENKLVLDPITHDALVDGYTISELKVEKVFSGEDIAVGTPLKLIEEYYEYYDPEEKEAVIFIQGSYLPAEEGESYIFFLKKCPDGTDIEGMYCPTDLEFGKYPVSVKKSASTAADFELRDNRVLTEYKEWYEKVKRDYMGS